jgi:hypothetical protein
MGLPRRPIAIMLSIALVVSALVVSALVVLVGLGLQRTAFGPWAPAISWQEMDGFLETQIIASTEVSLRVDPAAGSFSGQARLAVKSPGGEGGEVFFLLNPGLRIEAISIGEGELSFDRYRERVRVSLPPDTSACELIVRYSGRPVSPNSSTLVLEEELILLDKLQFWYPCDLKSFVSFSAELHVPTSFDVAWSGALKENIVREGTRLVRWEMDRPILGVGLALGVLERHTRVQGSVRCAVLGRNLNDGDVDAYLSAMGDAYNMLSTKLGSDNFGQLTLVVSGKVVKPVHAGGALILASPMDIADIDGLFVTVSGLIAQNWWGDTVSGRWFSTRPEAGEWLLTGLAEYYAWQALRGAKGRRAYLRYIETRHCSPSIDVPMNTYNLGRRLVSDLGFDGDPGSIRGAYAAAVISAKTGPDAFDRGCQNFMSVHRYTTVSYAALLHEITLASEVPLDELVRLWFNRPGTFDYRISQVEEDEDRVHISIENVGDIPANVALKIGIQTDAGYQVESIEPGAETNTYSFLLDRLPRRIVLDPEFEIGDMRRANNVWPKTEWPVALDVGPAGRIALLSKGEWGGDELVRLSVLSRVDKLPDYRMSLNSGTPSWFGWDKEGRQLGVVGPGLSIWSDGEWVNKTPGVGKGSSGFLDWGGTLQAAVSSEEAYTVLIPDTDEVVSVSPDGELYRSMPGEENSELLRDQVFPAGDLGWRSDESDLIYFERGGDLVSLSSDGEVRQVLLHRNYRIEHSRISPAGETVAWIDPAGLLRAFTPGGGEPVYISMPGEIVDFAWEGNEALIALVAVIPRRLPMRYHAEYSLWRVPVSTWQGIRLPYDTEQFAAVSPTVTSSTTR